MGHNLMLAITEGQYLCYQENDPVTLRRLAVLNCQLRKSENEKRTLQVANDQLMQFAEVNFII